MSEQLQITGKVTVKPYKCTKCGHESEQSTNHYGETYGACRSCGNTQHVCTADLPEGWGRPAPWKQVRLGDLVDIKA